MRRSVVMLLVLLCWSVCLSSVLAPQSPLLYIAIIIAVIAWDIDRLILRDRCPVCGYGMSVGIKPACARCHTPLATRLPTARLLCMLLGLILPFEEEFRCSTERWWVCMSEGWLTIRCEACSAGRQWWYEGWPPRGSLQLPTGLIGPALLVPMASYVIYAFAVHIVPPRVFRRGSCIHCGYDLTGNVTRICPECGKPMPPWQSPKSED